MTHSNCPLTDQLRQLRIEAAQAGLYVIEESKNKWMCLRKSDNNCLTRSELSEAMALRTGLLKLRVQQRQIDM